MRDVADHGPVFAVKEARLRSITHTHTMKLELINILKLINKHASMFLHNDNIYGIAFNILDLM